MRGTVGFDPALCSYGPATAAVQQILSEWMAIDWFEPPPTGAQDNAMMAFAEHNRRARIHQPELFPAELAITLARGGWPEFVELCARVRKQSWDWKFAALKQLSHRHSRARGWSLTESARDLAATAEAPGPGDLCFRFGERVFWNNLGPKLDLGSVISASDVNTVHWYLGYATMDLIECIEWQLAERHDRLDDNPFVPLLRCHASGLLAFSLGPAEVVLFGFVGL